MSSVFWKNKLKIQKKKVSVILFLVCVFLGMLLIALAAFFRLKTLHVTGCSFYTEDDITERFEKSVLDENTLIFYLKYKYFKNVNIPFVDGYELDFISPKEIHINIYEKSLISCIKYMGEYLYLDKDGVIVEISNKRMEDIPLVTGVSFQKMKLYDKLSVDDDSIFDTILDISLLIQRHKLDIDKIYFNYNKEVTLYSGDIKVLFGKQKSYDVQIANLKNLLSLAEQKKLTGVLDMQDYKEGQDDVILREN